MKIKKQKNKLIQLQALKIFNKEKNFHLNYNFKQIQIELHKISNIIFKYDITGRKILFIGFPTNFKKTIENTKHMVIPKINWINGMLLNQNSHNKNKITLNIFKLKKNFKKKVDLIVISNFKEKSTAIEESYILRIPTITINRKVNISNYKTTYQSIGDYDFINKKMEPNNLFISLIKATINKAKKSKKIKTYKNLRTLKKIYNKKHN